MESSQESGASSADVGWLKTGLVRKSNCSTLDDEWNSKDQSSRHVKYIIVMSYFSL